MKLLFDFFPIVLFLPPLAQGIFAATAVAIIASIIQILWVYFKNKKVDLCCG